MFHKTLCVAISAFLLTSISASANDKPSLGVGTTVFLELTGDLALKYCQLMPHFPKDNLRPELGISVSVSAQIVQNREDGTFRLEYVSPIFKNQKEPTLLTLTASLKSESLVVTQIPKGRLVSSSPADLFPVATSEIAESVRMQLSDVDDVKLRTWKVQSEIGD